MAQREDLALESRVAVAAVALAELFDLGEDLVGVALGNGRRGFALAPEDHGANRSRGNLALGLTQGGARTPRPGAESRARFGANASGDGPTSRAEVADNARAVAPRLQLLDFEASAGQQRFQPAGREAPVVALEELLMQLDQKRGGHDQPAARFAERVEVAHRRPRIGHVLEHLLADDEVESTRLGQRCAQIEVGPRERRVLAPRASPVQIAADLGDARSARIERVDLRFDGRVHHLALPMLACRVRRGEGGAIGSAEYAAGGFLEDAQNNPLHDDGIGSQTMLIPASSKPESS